MYSSTLSLTSGLHEGGVNATPWLIYPGGKRPSTHCVGGWVGLRAVLIGAENLAPSGIRSPDRPARSESLYRPTV